MKSVHEGAYQSPLPLVSPRAIPLGSLLGADPAAADAKLDGICEGIINQPEDV
jgi:hypothetical protein